MSLEMWQAVKKFRDGDDLSAEVLNVPIGQLGDRTAYLYARLKALVDGDSLSSVVLTNVDLSTETGKEPEVGNAVYLDGDRFALAKATMKLYDDFTAADSAFTVGILISKNGTSGNVLVYGRMNLNPGGAAISLSNMLQSGEEFSSGRYYLSANDAGRLTRRPNGPLIYVCTIDGSVNEAGGTFDSGTAIVTPQFLDIGTSHVHRTAVLTARPAGELSEDGKHVLGYGTIVSGPFHLMFGGTWTSNDRSVTYGFKLVVNGTAGAGYSLMWNEGAETGYPHRKDIASIGTPVMLSNGLTAALMVDGSAEGLDDDQMTWSSLEFPEAGRGWVDHVASDPNHDDNPTALYDYVLGMDQLVSNYWPPVPAQSAAVVVNGVEMDNKAFFPDNPTVSFGKDTIHWFTNDYGRKPWPEAFRSRSEQVAPADDKAMTMHWVRGFQCASGPVTSIQPKPGSPIKIYGYGSYDAANTGDLEIDAALDFEIVDGGAAGHMVPKRSENGKLIAGPVVERVIGGQGISIISQGGGRNGQGTVVVALENGAYRSQFSDIALENAEQAKIGMFPYIRLRGYTGSSISSPSAFTATMRVPTNLPSDGRYALRMQASVFGETGFSGASRQTASVRMAYNILPDYNVESGLGYSNLKSGLLRPDEDRIVNIPFGHVEGQGIVYNGFDPILIMTDDTEVENEDDVVQKVLGAAIPSAAEFVQQTVTDPVLRPGYLVGIRISRAVADGPGITPYRAALGFINLSWSLVAVD